MNKLLVFSEPLCPHLQNGDNNNFPVRIKENNSQEHTQSRKMWHVYTMEYYSAMKSNGIELFVVRWMDLETVIQSEVSQKEKNKYCMLTHIYGI